MMRMEQYGQLHDRPYSKATEPQQNAVQAGDTTTAPVPAQDAKAPPQPATVATRQKDVKPPLDPYATIVRTRELNKAVQALIAARKAALLSRAQQTAPKSHDTAPRHATPSQPRAAPVEHSAQISATIETARRMFEQIFKALQSLSKAASP